MNYKPDLNLEYDYIRVVYEVILSDLRTNKKLIEKDLNTIKLRLSHLKKKLNTSTKDAIFKANTMTLYKKKTYYIPLFKKEFLSLSF